ncbi:hypothetical protein [Ignicoccus hospitalis]|nr:hypothetical protein [Ignicoccus hospitalis]
MIQFSKAKGKVKVSVYIKTNGRFARESMRYIDDVIFELAPNFRRVYVVRSPNYEGVTVADRLWRWLTAGYSPKGALYYLKVLAPGKLGKKLAQKALESGAFSYNGCSGRLETNVLKKKENLEKLARETKVWEDSLLLCKFDGRCWKLREVLT